MTECQLSKIDATKKTSQIQNNRLSRCREIVEMPFVRHVPFIWDMRRIRNMSFDVLGMFERVTTVSLLALGPILISSFFSTKSCVAILRFSWIRFLRVNAVLLPDGDMVEETVFERVSTVLSSTTLSKVADFFELNRISSVAFSFTLNSRALSLLVYF